MRLTCAKLIVIIYRAIACGGIVTFSVNPGGDLSAPGARAVGQKLGGQLADARTSIPGDRAECSARGVVSIHDSTPVKLRMVEGIEELGAKLKCHAFVKSDILE